MDDLSAAGPEPTPEIRGLSLRPLRALGRARRAVWCGAWFLSAVCAASGARAHVRLVHPVPRTSSQKAGPCGAMGDGRTTDPSRITTFAPGETITVEFDEVVDHPGHFRIAFDDDGQDAFEDPTSATDIQETPVAPVLVDGITDRSGGGLYTVEVTLPDIECTRCTLQLIQLMADRAPYGDGNDLYYQCADLILAAGDGAGGTSSMGGAGPTTGGVWVSTGGSSGGTSGTNTGGRSGGTGGIHVGGSSTGGVNTGGFGTGGVAAGGVATGGTSFGIGGAIGGSAAAPNTGGSATTGGALLGAGGTMLSTGGISPSTGGAPASDAGGTWFAGGTSGTAVGGTPGASLGGVATDGGSSDGEPGCSCRTGSSSASAVGAGVLWLGLVAFALRRRSPASLRRQTLLRRETAPRTIREQGYLV